ncbi:hypothetical protein ACIBCA_15335 [Kitasatospora sp. NPDC051170]|uniref:hypothetical protein n=1 Tax=Kitasatospora sp. NPDC051170 TaxID=3364056 RepID=UPI00379CD1DC
MRRRLTLAGAAVAGVLVLAGCSGSHGDEAACPPPAPVASASPVTAAPLASSYRSADAPGTDRAAKGSKGSKGSGGGGSKPGRTVHHHIDHHDSSDGTDGGYGHCHGASAPTPSKPSSPVLPGGPGGPATAPKK